MMPPIDKLALLIIRDRRLLMARTSGVTTFYTPGGKREFGESDAEALAREIKEELSVSVDIGSLRYHGVFETHAHGKQEGTIVRVICYMGACKGVIRPSGEVEEVTWLSTADREQTSQAGQMILNDLASKGLID